MTLPRLGQNRARSSAYLVFASVAAAGAGIVGGLILTRVFVPEQYGAIAYFMRAFTVIRWMGNLGLGVKVTQEVSHHTELGDWEAIGRTYYTLGLVRILSGFVLTVALVSVGWLLHNPMLTWASVTGLLASLADFVDSVVKGFRKHRAVAVLALVQQLAFLVFVVCLILANQTKPTLVYIGFAFSFLLTLLVGCVAVRDLPVPAPKYGSLSWSYLFEAIGPLAGMFLYLLLDSLYLALGTLILGQADLLKEAAYFSLIIGLVAMPTGVGAIMILAVFYPGLVATLVNRAESAVEWFVTFTKISLVILALMAGLTMVHSRFLATALYGDSYADISVGLSIASPIIVLLYLQHVLGYTFFALKRPELANRGMVVQISLGVLGILALPVIAGQSRIAGMALVYLAASTAGLLVHWSTLRSVWSVRLSLWRVPKAIGLAAATGMLGKLVATRLFSGVDALIFVAGAALSVPLYLGLAWILVLEGEERQVVVDSCISPIRVWFERKLAFNRGEW